MAVIVKNKVIYGGSTPITVDNGLDSTSENPVQNKVIKDALDDKQDALNAGDGIEIDDSLNEISIDEMPSEDMSQILYPLPPTETEEHSMNSNIYYYVDADNGDDSNGGKTPATAFKTIQHAINVSPHWKYYKENDTLGAYATYIRVNTSAQNPYAAFAVNNCFAEIVTWNFTTDTRDANGILTISTSTAANCIYTEYSQLNIYAKDIVITNTKSGGQGIYISRCSNCTIFSSGDSITHNLTINTNSTGLRASIYSMITINGNVANNDQLTITATSQGINCTDFSCMHISPNVSISATNLAIFINNHSRVGINGTGATENKKAIIDIISTSGNTQCIRVSDTSSFICTITYSSIRILHNHATVTNHSVEASQNSFITIASSYELNIESKSSSNSVVRSTSGSAFSIQFGTDASKNYIKGNSSSTGWAINCDGGGIFTVNGGTANVSPVLMGNNGIGAYLGGMVAYANIKNNATRPTGTNTGGRIYTGAQTSVPNY